MALNELFGPLQWIVAGGFWQTLGICLVICPGIPQLLGLVFCSYWAPWNWHDQFLAYIPGNPFLAVFIAGMSTVFDHGHVPIPWWVNIGAMVGATAIYVVLTFVMDAQAYTKEQLWSWNKVWHNLLYFWYGYLTFVCFWAMWGTDASVLRKLTVTLVGMVWVACLAVDTYVGAKKPALQQRKLSRAHADNWSLLRTGFRLRKWTPQGYRLKL